MVRTGARASALAVLLERGGHVQDPIKPPAPRLNDFGRDLVEELHSLYVALGGIQERPNLRPGSWDLSIDGVLLELDEELHFNRYRHVSIENQTGSRLPWADEYLDACVRYEANCLRAGRWGARWTSRSSERMFGEAATPGVLDESSGAPRWKQRALYDAMKDAAARASPGQRVARLSVWDTVSGALLGDALRGHVAIDVAELSQLFASRTSGIAT